MIFFARLSLYFALTIALAACVSGDGGESSGVGAGSGGLQSDGTQVGYLVIGSLHPDLNSVELNALDAAEFLSSKRQLTIGGSQLREQYIDPTRPYFEYSGFARNSERAFEIKYYGTFDGQEIELLSATGNHTFKTYEPASCKPSRGVDCVDVEQSDVTSTSLEQQLQISDLELPDCDGDGNNNLQEFYSGTNPCGTAEDPVQVQMVVATQKSPSNNAVLEIGARYNFSFSASTDDLHTAYVVRVYAGETENTLVGQSNNIAVLGTANASYNLDVALSLSAGKAYNWRVYGINPDNSRRSISTARLFSTANAVPVLSQSTPANNSERPYVVASTGHQFRFSSSTDIGVHEYRVHLTDESNHIDYGYKRLNDSNNSSGGSYATTRNLALSQGARHRWYVTANTESGSVLAQTPTREFNVLSVNYSINLGSPSDQALLDVVSDDVGYNFSFSSNSNTGVSEYRVYLRDTTTGADYGYKRINANGSNNYTTTRNLNLAANATHIWYVTANSSSGEQLALSSERQFTTQAIANSTVLNISDSQNLAVRPYNSSDVGHTFYFNSSSDVGVSEYRVYVNEIGIANGGGYGYKTVAAGSSASGGAYSTTRNLALNAAANHEFYVTANDSSGNELANSGTSNFVIADIVVSDPPSFTQNQPIGELPWASQSIGYNFEFNVANATAVDKYRVYVNDIDTPQNFSYKEIDAAASTSSSGVVSTTRNINTNSIAQHEWYVTALDSSGNVLAQSNTVSFLPTVPELSEFNPVTGSSVSHSDSGYSFTFRSANDAGVAEYRVYVYDISNDDASFDYKTVAPLSNSGPSDYTVQRNINLKLNAENRWRVAALDAAGIEMISSDWMTFNIVP